MKPNGHTGGHPAFPDADITKKYDAGIFLNIFVNKTLRFRALTVIVDGSRGMVSQYYM